jgi:hypothetical protein
MRKYVDKPSDIERSVYTLVSPNVIHVFTIAATQRSTVQKPLTEGIYTPIKRFE